MIQPDRTTNDTIQYVCEDGYFLRGSSILKCVSTEWKPTPPVCERRPSLFLSWVSMFYSIRRLLAISCEDPLLTFNGFVESPSINNASIYSIDSIVYFSCPTNMTLRGSRLSKCLWNGTWSPKLPRCESELQWILVCFSIATVWLIESIPCPVPPLPDNAEYVQITSSQNHLQDGQHLEYRCENSLYRHRITCRRGKILPRLPMCYRGRRKREILRDNAENFFGYLNRLFCDSWQRDLFQAILSSSRTCLLLLQR